MEKHLHILWTNADPLTSEFMLMMYAVNSITHHWWDKVTVIIWGATARLAVENEAIRAKIELAIHTGVQFSACVTCALNLGVREELERMGIEVKPWGEPLTELIQNKEHLITI